MSKIGKPPPSAPAAGSAPQSEGPAEAPVAPPPAMQSVAPEVTTWAAETLEFLRARAEQICTTMDSKTRGRRQVESFVQLIESNGTLEPFQRLLGKGQAYILLNAAMRWERNTHISSSLAVSAEGRLITVECRIRDNISSRADRVIQGFPKLTFREGVPSRLTQAEIAEGLKRALDALDRKLGGTSLPVYDPATRYAPWGLCYENPEDMPLPNTGK